MRSRSLACVLWVGIVLLGAGCATPEPVPVQSEAAKPVAPAPVVEKPKLASWAGFRGVRFGSSPEDAPWLEKTTAPRGASAHVSAFTATDRETEQQIGAVTLHYQFPKYHYFDGKFYEVEARYSWTPSSFDELLAIFTQRYGKPGLLVLWKDAPPSSVAGSQRANLAAWRAPDGGVSISILDSPAQCKFSITELVGKAEREAILEQDKARVRTEAVNNL